MRLLLLVSIYMELHFLQAPFPAFALILNKFQSSVNHRDIIYFVTGLVQLSAHIWYRIPLNRCGSRISCDLLA